MSRHQVVRWFSAASLAALLVASAAAPAWAGQPPQGEFVPMSELPKAESLPAASLLVAAYVVVWAALLLFVWSIWRRLGAVARDLAELQRRVAKHPKG